jgi:signal transduction histidine kinase
MKNLGIKAKLILLFVIMKVIPLLIISYIAIVGAKNIGEYFTEDSVKIITSGEKVLKDTANIAISDSIKALDKRSQESIERLTFEIATSVADFLYERDNDLLFLSNTKIDKNILQSFYNSKQRAITTHGKYSYDETTNTWITDQKISKSTQELKADLKDNEKEFSHNPRVNIKKKKIPIYKEITFFDLYGKEKIKVSSIDKKLLDISKKENTYIKAEEYFTSIKSLKRGDIYVSDVIGAYTHSNLIGTFTKEKAKKMGIEFKPQDHAYAGIENPVGKRFEAIVRFITPVYKKNKKIGYISLALDHRHIREFTDYKNASKDAISNIPDASRGDYAFMWDHMGRNISHPRDYFIPGFDPSTGKRVAPWVSKDIAEKFKQSKSDDLVSFLEKYPTYEDQSLQKKPNIEQLKKSGELGLDCRYLNFAPQCQGWMQLVKDGGYGSFVIYWSKLWKLTTAAAIPYYSGQYGANKVGFGFVTIGANVDEFHKAANKTKENLDNVLKEQSASIQSIVENSEKRVTEFIVKIVNELTISTIVMVAIVIIIAILMSDYITNHIKRLIDGTKKFSNNELDHRIAVESNDEIGELSNAFNNMADSIATLIEEQQELNNTLEEKVKDRTKELQESLQNLKEAQKQLIESEKMAALGGLVAGIAHEVNTPIGIGVTAASDLVLKTKDIRDKYLNNQMKKSDLDKYMSYATQTNDLLLKNLDRAATLINSFKKVAVEQNSLEKSKFNVLEYTKDTISTISPKFKSQNYKFDITGDNIEIDNYAGDYTQVITNLVMNSITHGFDESGEGKISIDIKDKDKNIEIIFSDNGKGIPKENISKIFDPFFTTKRGSGGSGLGLHIIYNIVTNKLNGTINCHSDDSGTKFVIDIPKVG